MAVETKRISWDGTGEKEYECGVDHGVLYPCGKSGYEKGVAWNGLTSVSENPSGAEVTKHYADNIVYATTTSAEDYGVTIECFMYPEEFKECDGRGNMVPGVTVSQQPRKSFGLCYRTLIGNDTEGEAHGYKLHIIYGCKCTPSERSYSTINESVEPMTLSYEATCTPVIMPGENNLKPACAITIESTKVDETKLHELEDILYGTEMVEPKLPLPNEVAEVFAED